MMNISVSVIVPVYNAEKYIKVCVDSILAQTLKNVEVILVDDCSSDNSLKLCEDLYSSNERVKIITQPKNMGAGAARNAGIKKAVGEYIAFVDSDDEVQPDMFETLYGTAKKFNADVVHSTQTLLVIPPFPEEGKPYEVPIEMKNQDYFPVVMDTNPAKEITLLDDNLEKRLVEWFEHKYHWSVWSKIYRREFLIENGIEFSDMKLAEDMVFCFACLFMSKNYVVNPGAFYIYRLSTDSMMRSAASEKKHSQICTFTNSCRKQHEKIYRQNPVYKIKS